LLAQPVPALPHSSGRRGSARRTPDRSDYEASVRVAKGHIRAGDAFQIVLSQRAERPTSASALELYRALRRVNPSPYLFLLELEGLALIGSSPETLVKCEGRRLRAAGGRHTRHVHRDQNDRPPRRRCASAGRCWNRRRFGPCSRARGVPAQTRSRRGGDRPRRGGSTLILLIDNYDSFTYNL